MAIKYVTSHTAVADLVTNVKPCTVQYTFGWDSWISTGATLQFCNTEGETENLDLFKYTLMFCDYKISSKCNYHFPVEKSQRENLAFGTEKINCENVSIFLH